MESTDDITFEQFRDDNFLILNTLDVRNVLEYFYTSRFFDPNSLNQLRRRGIDCPPDSDGIEFRVVAASDAGRGLLPQPFNSAWNIPNQFGTFVIQKFRRKAGTETPLECFYVIGGTIYGAPSFASVIRQRILLTVRCLETSLKSVSDLLGWSLTGGYIWGFLPADADDFFSEADSVLVGQQPDAAPEPLQKPRGTTKGGARTVFAPRSIPGTDRILEDFYTKVMTEGEQFYKESSEKRLAWAKEIETLNLI